MMTAGLFFVLLMFALVGFVGAGASLAMARMRYMNDGVPDAGMLGIAGMLFVFGALCTSAGSGLVGVLVLGGVGMWIGYVVAAQRLGLFEIETGWYQETHASEPRQPT